MRLWLIYELAFKEVLNAARFNSASRGDGRHRGSGNFRLLHNREQARGVAKMAGPPGRQGALRQPGSAGPSGGKLRLAARVMWGGGRAVDNKHGVDIPRAGEWAVVVGLAFRWDVPHMQRLRSSGGVEAGMSSAGTSRVGLSVAVVGYAQVWPKAAASHLWPSTEGSSGTWGSSAFRVPCANTLLAATGAARCGCAARRERRWEGRPASRAERRFLFWRRNASGNCCASPGLSRTGCVRALCYYSTAPFSPALPMTLHLCCVVGDTDF